MKQERLLQLSWLTSRRIFKHSVKMCLLSQQTWVPPVRTSCPSLWPWSVCTMNIYIHLPRLFVPSRWLHRLLQMHWWCGGTLTSDVAKCRGLWVPVLRSCVPHARGGATYFPSTQWYKQSTRQHVQHLMFPLRLTRLLTHCDVSRTAGMVLME